MRNCACETQVCRERAPSRFFVHVFLQKTPTACSTQHVLCRAVLPYCLRSSSSPDHPRRPRSLLFVPAWRSWLGRPMDGRWLTEQRPLDRNQDEQARSLVSRDGPVRKTLGSIICTVELDDTAHVAYYVTYSRSLVEKNIYMYTNNGLGTLSLYALRVEFLKERIPPATDSESCVHQTILILRCCEFV